MLGGYKMRRSIKVIVMFILCITGIFYIFNPLIALPNRNDHQELFEIPRYTAENISNQSSIQFSEQELQDETIKISEEQIMQYHIETTRFNIFEKYKSIQRFYSGSYTVQCDEYGNFIINE